jgi:hypothetical protein
MVPDNYKEIKMLSVKLIYEYQDYVAKYFNTNLCKDHPDIVSQRGQNIISTMISQLG